MKVVLCSCLMMMLLLLVVGQGRPRCTSQAWQWRICQYRNVLGYPDHAFPILNLVFESIYLC